MENEIKEYEEGDKNPFMSEEEYSVNSQKIKKEDNLMGKSSGDTNFENGSYNHLKDSQKDNQSSDNTRQTKQGANTSSVDYRKSENVKKSVSLDKTAEILNSEYPWKYKCGHTSKGLILDDNILSMTKYLEWKDSVGIDGDKSMCWNCYLDSKEQKICEKTNCRECQIKDCGARG